MTDSAKRSIPLEQIIRSWIGSLLGIGLIAWTSRLDFSEISYLLIVGSFGASAVLLFAAPNSPFAQPRNMFAGQALSALIGAGCYLLFQEHFILATSFSVAVSILAMQLTQTLHPPAGATALIAVLGGPEVHHLGFLYVVPILFGVSILFFIALLSQNLFSGHRRYPLHWW